MNNKGFAITGIIYGLMLIFILTITSFLSILIGRNRRIDSLVETIYENLKYSAIPVSKSYFEDDDKVYETKERALYDFYDLNCKAYLPKNVVLVLGAVKNPSNPSDSNTIYYSKDGGESLDKYYELTCIK